MSNNNTFKLDCFQIIIFVLTRTAQHAQYSMLQSIRSIIRNKKNAVL